MFGWTNCIKDGKIKKMELISQGVEKQTKKWPKNTRKQQTMKQLFMYCLISITTSSQELHTYKCVLSCVQTTSRLKQTTLKELLPFWLPTSLYQAILTSPMQITNKQKRSLPPPSPLPTLPNPFPPTQFTFTPPLCLSKPSLFTFLAFAKTPSWWG